MSLNPALNNVEHVLIAFGHQEEDGQKVLSLLSSFSDPTSLKDVRFSDNLPLLHKAARNGWWIVAKELVAEYDCDPGYEDNEGSNLLHIVCLFGQTDLVQYLTSTFCMDPLKENKNGFTPLEFSGFSRGKNVKQFLERIIDDSKQHGFESVVEFLKHCRNEKHEAAVAEAMKEGAGDLVQSNILLHGPPGAGKTSFIRLLIGLSPLPKEKQSATDILDSTVRAVCSNRMKQFKVVDNVELISMLAEEVNYHGTKKEERHQDTSTNKDAFSETAAANTKSGKSSEAVTPSQKHTTSTSIQNIRDCLGRSSRPVKLFDSCWHHVIDSGGQPQFQDILPLVHHNPSLSIIVIRLTDMVDTKPKVCFHEEGRNVYTLPDHLVLNNRELIISTCQIAENRVASLQGIISYVMIIGTHKDMLGRNGEAKIREWNQALAGIRKEFGKVLICKSEEEIIFAVNTMVEGRERQECTRELQECITAATERYASPVKVPLRWLAYELDLDKDEGVVRLSDCYKGGEALGMGKLDVQNALKFFSKVALVLYFPEDIPDLVLTKIDPFIGRLSKLVKASFIPPKYCPAEDSDRLRAKGLFHTSFLAKVFQDIKTHELHDSEFLKLLECLKIAVKVGKSEYFLPSALSLQSIPEESTFQMYSVPLVFKWDECILPHGFFFTVAIELLGNPSEKCDNRFELRTDIAQWRGEIQVSEVDGKIPGVVKLINRTRWIQVCSSSRPRHCPTIYKAVDVAVQKTVKRFEHTGIRSPTVTVLCPLCETKDHYCLLSADKKEFTCSVNKSKTGTVTPDMLCWTQGRDVCNGKKEVANASSIMVRHRQGYKCLFIASLLAFLLTILCMCTSYYWFVIILFTVGFGTLVMTFGISEEIRKVGLSKEYDQENNSLITSIMKKHNSQLLRAISHPDHLASDMWSNDLITDNLRDDLQTKQGLSRYEKANMLMTELYRNLNVGNKGKKQLNTFCDVLRSQDDSVLDQIADDIGKELDST